MSLLHSVAHSARIQDILFVDDPADASCSVLLIAAENKKVAAYVIAPRSSATSAEAGDAADTVNTTEADDGPTLGIFAEFVGHTNR